MKIYTKKGDQGKTGLIGGTRVSKSSLRIECYGTVDELNSYLGVLRTIIKSESSISEIIDIQDSLFTIGSHLACDPDKKSMKLPEIKSSDINWKISSTVHSELVTCSIKQDTFAFSNLYSNSRFNDQICIYSYVIVTTCWSNPNWAHL